MQGKKLLQQGIDDLKLVTRRYAKKQDKWVMNRLIRRGDRQVIHLPCFIINLFILWFFYNFKITILRRESYFYKLYFFPTEYT